jgi:L-rhamnose isomerase
VHILTGVTPSVTLHIPWDKTDDWTARKEYAKQNIVQESEILVIQAGSGNYRRKCAWPETG